MPGAGPKPPTRCFPVGCGALCVCVHILARRCCMPPASSCTGTRACALPRCLVLPSRPCPVPRGCPALPLFGRPLPSRNRSPAGSSRPGAAGQRSAGSRGVRPGGWQGAHPCPALGLCVAGARVSGSGLGRREPSPRGATSDVGPMLASAGGSGLGAPAPLTLRHGARVRPVSLPALCPCWPRVPGHVQHRAHAAVPQPWAGLRARGDGCWGLLTSPGSPCGGRGQTRTLTPSLSPMVSLLSQASICWRIRWKPLDDAVGIQDSGLPIPFPPGNDFQAHGEEKPDEEWAVWTSNRDTELSRPDCPHSEVAGWVEEEGSGCCSPPQ